MICHVCRCVVGVDNLLKGQCKDPVLCSKRLSNKLKIKAQKDDKDQKRKKVTNHLDKFR